jgi:chemotaxis protein CheD
MDAPAAATRHITIAQGEHRASGGPEVVMSTLLGSCVAACIYDPVVGVGGMNHFLLPGETAKGADARGYGAHLMELLINSMMRLGAQRPRMRAKLFGGARMMAGLSDIGRRNATFAQTYLDDEGIGVVSADLGGERARRVQFWTASGRARIRYSAPGEASAAFDPRLAVEPVAPCGDIELFLSPRGST